MLFKDSCFVSEDRRQFAWGMKYSDNTADQQTSHLSENSSNITNCHLEEPEEQTKRSRQIHRVSNLFDKDNQIAKNSKSTSERLPISQSSSSSNKQNLALGVINDDIPGSSSALAFRPWGTEKTEEGVDQLDYPVSRPTSDARPYKGIVYKFRRYSK